MKGRAHFSVIRSSPKISSSSCSCHNMAKQLEKSAADARAKTAAKSSARSEQIQSLSATLEDQGFDPSDAAAAANYASSIQSAHAWLSKKVNASAWPADVPIFVPRPPPPPSAASSASANERCSGGCDCCEEDCTVTNLRITALFCPVVASCIYEQNEDHWDDEMRPGYQLIWPTLVGCSQLFCCHIGGVALAMITMRADRGT